MVVHKYIKLTQATINGGEYMDKNRAKEIRNSEIMANVTYKGNNVYIKNVNEKKGTATVQPFEDTKNIQEVSLDSLIEN